MWEGAILGAAAPSLQPAGEEFICSSCPLQDLIAPGCPKCLLCCLAPASPLGLTKESRLCWPSSQGSKCAVLSRVGGTQGEGGHPPEPPPSLAGSPSVP